MAGERAEVPEGEAFDAWRVGAERLPEGEGHTERLAFAVHYAVLAPSGHNTQPWLFRVEGDHVDVLADRSRGLAVVDPDDRELTISCGAATGTLALAARCQGLDVEVAVLPDPADGDVLARVTATGDTVPSSAELAHFRAITARRTNRGPYDDRPVGADVIAALEDAAAAEGAWFAPVEGDERAGVADLVAEGDRTQFHDKRFRRELAAWLHPNSARAADGLRGYGYGFDDVMSHVGPHVIRRFDLGKGQAARDHELATGSPLLAVLGTLDDETASWLAAGRALTRVLLTACAAGVTASYLNQPCEQPDLRARLGEVVGRPGVPQLVLRLGHGTDVPPAPRRPVADVLV